MKERRHIMWYVGKGTVNLTDRNGNEVNMTVEDLLDDNTVEVEEIVVEGSRFIPLAHNDFAEESTSYVDDEEMLERAEIIFANMLHAEAEKQGYELVEYDLTIEKF